MKWNLNSGRFDLTDFEATDLTDPGAKDLTDLKDLLNLMPLRKPHFKPQFIPLKFNFY